MNNIGIFVILVGSVICSNVADSSNVGGDVTKRDLKTDAVISKSYDPPPEYYRGPGSPFERDRTKDRDVAGSYGHDARYPQKGALGGQHDINRRHGQDRVGIGGQYGTSFGESSYGDSGHHYGQIPYGQPQAIDFTSGYSSTGPGGNSKYPYTGHYLPEYPIAFDLGHRDYGYSYPPSDYYHNKAELAKSFLLPLAGVAILGVTAALIANPVLLQLGTVSAGKRRRRDLNGNSQSLQIPLAHHLAYRGFARN